MRTLICSVYVLILLSSASPSMASSTNATELWKATDDFLKVSCGTGDIVTNIKSASAKRVKNDSGEEEITVPLLKLGTPEPIGTATFVADKGSFGREPYLLLAIDGDDLANIGSVRSGTSVFLRCDP